MYDFQLLLSDLLYLVASTVYEHMNLYNLLIPPPFVLLPSSYANSFVFHGLIGSERITVLERNATHDFDRRYYQRH